MLVYDASKGGTWDVRARCAAFTPGKKRADRPLSGLDDLTIDAIRQRVERVLEREDKKARGADWSGEPIYGSEGISGSMLRYHGVDAQTKTLAQLRHEGGWRRIAVFAVTGDNEGHYVHVELVRATQGRERAGVSGDRLLLWLGKTFHGRAAAYRTAERIAQLLDA